MNASQRAPTDAFDELPLKACNLIRNGKSAGHHCGQAPGGRVPAVALQVSPGVAWLQRRLACRAHLHGEGEKQTKVPWLGRSN